MMISDLPSDLIEHILFRVPVTYLGISRFTCKRWNGLVEDPRFIKYHFDKASRQSLVVTLMNSRVYSASFNLHGIHNNVDPSIEFTRKLNLLNSGHNSEVDINKVIHCDGLLLCIIKKTKRLVVWNPCTGQTIWLKTRKRSTCLFDTYSLGYENKILCHKYKILRRFFNGSRQRMEIFEFCSNSWRLLDDDFPPNCIIQNHFAWVSLKGNTYWIALSKNNQDNHYVVLSFDFSTERFQCLPFPCHNHGLDCDWSLAVVREEQLSVLHLNLDTGNEMEIWVSTKIETTSVSWSKLLKVRVGNPYYLPLNNGESLLINYDKKAVVCFQNHSRFTGNLVQEEEDKFREISLGESTDHISWGDTFSYVPSLARIQQGIVTGRGKRKRS